MEKKDIVENTGNSRNHENMPDRSFTRGWGTCWAKQAWSPGLVHILLHIPGLLPTVWASFTLFSLKWSHSYLLDCAWDTTSCFFFFLGESHASCASRAHSNHSYRFMIRSLVSNANFPALFWKKIPSISFRTYLNLNKTRIFFPLVSPSKSVT